MRIDDPLVSVIIPTFGRPDLLRETLQSVIGQSYENLEIIVVDDCSPFPIELDTDDGRVRVIRHERNLGPGAARNTALAVASGEFVAFLDDDDLFAFDRIERGVREIGDARIHVVRSNISSRRYEGDMRRSLHHADPPSTLQVLIRREDVCSFDPTLRVSEDIDWWLRMTGCAVFAWSDTPGLWVREHDTPRPGVDPAVRLQCRKIVALRHARALDRRSRAHQFSRVSVSALQAENRRATAGYAMRSLAAWPTTLGLRLLVRGLTPGALWSRP